MEGDESQVGSPRPGSRYGQLAVALAARRQAGILKRIRATPLPAWAYFAGLLAHCVLVSVIDIALIVVVGRLYGCRSRRTGSRSC